MSNWLSITIEFSNISLIKLRLSNCYKIWWKSFKISFEKQDFPKVWMKYLENARLQDFAPNTTDPLPRCARLAMRVDVPPPGNSCQRAWNVYIQLEVCCPLFCQSRSKQFLLLSCINDGVPNPDINYEEDVHHINAALLKHARRRWA